MTTGQPITFVIELTINDLSITRADILLSVMKSGFETSCNYNVIDFELLVFDQWGGFVYESNDMNLSWNGAVNGKDLNRLSYYLIILDGYPALRSFRRPKLI